MIVEIYLRPHKAWDMESHVHLLPAGYGRRSACSMCSRCSREEKTQKMYSDRNSFNSNTREPSFGPINSSVDKESSPEASLSRDSIIIRLNVSHLLDQLLTQGDLVEIVWKWSVGSGISVSWATRQDGRTHFKYATFRLRALSFKPTWSSFLLPSSNSAVLAIRAQLHPTSSIIETNSSVS